MTLEADSVEYERIVNKLHYELGSEVCCALDDPEIQEIMCNADGSLWVERHGKGMARIGAMTSVNAKMLVGTVAHSLGTVCNADAPIVEGALVLDGSRFEGLLPPACRAPVWVIRKRATKVYTLDDYGSSGVLTASQVEFMRECIVNRRNLLIAGGTGTGKTTFANALIHAIAEASLDERLVIIEDTPELQCSARNVVMLETTRHVTMTDLLRSTMRLRPDRILVGEVRGGEALTLLKSWNTGHPGGIATVHAQDVPGAALRMRSLAAEAGGPSFRDLERIVDETLDVTVVIAREKDGSRTVIDIGNHLENRYAN